MKYSKEFYEATDIQVSCFVFASAGSGKTKILVDRFIKTLYFGFEPQEILCITFTNAAVREMECRISDILERLYLNEDNFTEKYLRETLGINEISQLDIEKATGLFFKFQNNLSHLKILTIHAFCESLLRQFPLESGISPNFRVMGDVEALALMHSAKDYVLNNLPDEVIKKFSKLVSMKTLKDFVDGIYQLLPKFTAFFSNKDSVADYEREISSLFHLSPFQNFSNDQNEFIEQYFANADLEEAYLTKSGTLRKKIPFDQNPISHQVAEIVLSNFLRQKKIKTIDRTGSFLKIVKDVIDRYRDLKDEENVLDFSDVLYKAKFLLTQSCAKEFVISRICNRIKSIMIDEAQDLSPIQWDLITLFSEDVHSDPSKTIFIVGDVKQSIYRFQGADCNLFSEFYKRTSDIFQKANKPLKTVYLDTNFRSLSGILEGVDKVFEGEVAESIFGDNFIKYQRHKAFRGSPHGNFKVFQMEDDVSIPSQVAQIISELKTDDSLILTRSRNELFNGVVNELSNLKIETVQSDKINLKENLLVMDLLALADICIDYTDDYALCCVLKSPFIFERPLNDDDLFDLCYRRICSTFENLKSLYPEKYNFLEKIISNFDENDPQKFFYFLTTKLHRLSAIDSYVVAGFMNEVTDFSKIQAGSVFEFLQYLRTNDVEILNQGFSRTGLKLSTIHGAKGLEAKTVFLLDFDLKADKQKTKFLFKNDMFFIKPSEKDSFPEIRQFTESEYEEEERELLRLLYVAMTRARDDLYILSSSQRNGKTASSLIESKCFEKEAN